MTNKMENKNDVEMEKNYTVYMHISPNGKRYIGITRRIPEKRWGKNGNGYKKHEYFYNAIQKHGWDNFEHIIIENNLTKEQAENMEIELIAKYRSTEQDRGYNIDNGGNTTGTHSIETRKKMSKNHADIKGGKHPLAKKVYCDGLIFDCLTQCGDYYSINRRTITRLIKGEIKMNSNFQKLNLRYATNEDLNKYEKYDASKHGDKVNIVKAYVKKGIGLRKGLMVYCDGLIFNTMKECANYYSVGRNSISRWLQGEHEMPLDFQQLNLRYATDEDLNTYPRYTLENN